MQQRDFNQGERMLEKGKKFRREYLGVSLAIQGLGGFAKMVASAK